MLIEILPRAKFDLAKEMLKKADLPYHDIEDGNLVLYSCVEKEQIIGIGGYEQYGESALIRSVAIDNNLRGRGIGTLLVKEIESQAIKNGIKTFYLLTTTADQFFAKINYLTMNREDVPKLIKNTSEFSSICPSSAVCMYKKLI